MQIQQIRNATIKINFAGKVFLVDPWLASKGATGTFKGLPYRCPFKEMEMIPMPMCDLPMPVPEVLAGVDAYIITHVHPDHIDIGAEGIVGAPLEKATTTFVQNEKDREIMIASGFKDVRILRDQTEFGGVILRKIQGRHGTIKACGDSCGVVFQSLREKGLYLVGDTVWFDRVQCALIEYKPDVIIVNACAATLVDEGRLIMNDEDIAKISEVSPMATIIASHMDTVAHAMLNRLTLKDALMKRAVHNVKIIGDGEVMHF